MREKQIESKLVIEVKKIGGIAPKLVSPGFDGMPDRLVLLPDGHIAFVELKAPRQKAAPAAAGTPPAPAVTWVSCVRYR